MMSILENLWYGNIEPQEAYLENDKHISKLLTLIDKNRDKLNDTLTDQQKELLEKYESAVKDFNCNAEEAAFEYGFSLGARMIIDCFKRDRHISLD